MIVDKFKNKYRIASARAAWWDYGWAGAYFITICSAQREHFFGEIINGKMNLTHVGILADVFWHEIPNHAQNVELGAFVVMPNHIHGILILNGENKNNANAENNANANAENNANANANVETRHALSLQSPPSPSPSPSLPAQKRFQNQGKNTVSSVIGAYKSAVTKHANRLGLESGWQARFHDHIIRDDAQYQRINDYIEANVSAWENDMFFKKDDQ